MYISCDNKPAVRRPEVWELWTELSNEVVEAYAVNMKWFHFLQE